MLSNIDRFPQEFYKFMEKFTGIPIAFSNPKIAIENEELDFVERTSVKYGDALECEVRISYISNIDYESFNIDYESQIASILKDDDEDPEYKNEVIKELEEKKKIVKYWSNQSFPSDFKGYVITPDLAVSLDGNLIQAMITSQDIVIVLYGNLDTDGRLNDFIVSSYNLFDFAKSWDNEDDDFVGLQINCDNITKRVIELESKGINPTEKINLNFKHFLSEYGLENMYDKPLVAIYTAKEILLNKMLKDENYKRK